jgi:excisionase family DNA binding protein
MNRQSSSQRRASQQAAPSRRTGRDAGSRQEPQAGHAVRSSFDPPITVAQAARILGASPSTIRRLMREGRIAHERISPRRTVIRESALRAYIDSVTVEARS